MTDDPENFEQKSVEKVTVNSRIQKMLDDFWKEKVVAEYRDNANIAHYVQNRKDTRLIMEQWSTEMLSLYRFIGYTSFIGILANVIHGKILHEKCVRKMLSL